MMKSFPNILSWSRIVSAPVISVMYFFPGALSFVAFLLFVIAAVTDYVDGKLARDFGLTTPFGIFLDPVADKILVVVVLLTLVASPPADLDGTLLTVVAGLIILREVIQSSLRDWMAQAGNNKLVEVTFWSKLKTVLQLVALGWLLAYQPLVWLGYDWSWVAYVGFVLLTVSAVLGLITLFKFLMIAIASMDKQ